MFSHRVAVIFVVVVWNDVNTSFWKGWVSPMLCTFFTSLLFSYVIFALVSAMLAVIVHFRPFANPGQQRLVNPCAAVAALSAAVGIVVGCSGCCFWKHRHLNHRSLYALHFWWSSAGYFQQCSYFVET